MMARSASFRSVVFGIAASLAFVLTTSDSLSQTATKDAKRVTIKEEISPQADLRLTALKEDPSLLKRLDQRSNFGASNNGKAILSASMTQVARFFPVLKKVKSADCAVCIADGKVFFRLASGGKVYGWVTLKDPSKSQKECKFVIWIETGERKAMSHLSPVASAALGALGGKDGEVTHSTMTIRKPIKVEGHTTGYDIVELSVSQLVPGLLQIEGKLPPHTVRSPSLKPMSFDEALGKAPAKLAFWPPEGAVD